MRIARDNTQFIINHLFELPTENSEVGPIVMSFMIWYYLLGYIAR